MFPCKIYRPEKYEKQIKEDKEIDDELQDGIKTNIGTNSNNK